MRSSLGSGHPTEWRRRSSRRAGQRTGRLYRTGAERWRLHSRSSWLQSGYSPLGAAIISDRIFEPFAQGTVAFPRGYTFGGHPVSCAVGLANLDIFEREDLFGNVLRHENSFRQTLERLYDLPIVGDVRGDGYLYATELVKDKVTKETLHPSEVEKGAARLHCRRVIRQWPLLPPR
jgi:adenosylmethionine-8-amino-7-oxononanoate aminotransferase